MLYVVCGMMFGLYDCRLFVQFTSYLYLISSVVNPLILYLGNLICTSSVHMNVTD